MKALILASGSPRRRELLTRAGIPFEVFSCDVDETCSLPAAETVCELSRRKALAAATSCPGRYVLAADTLVALDGVKMGKPLDQDQAVDMLRRLSGQTHQVFTGVSLYIPSGDCLTAFDRTDVTFSAVSDTEIMDYVRSGEPMDKAGAYAIQGKAGLWIRSISGSDTSVIGLPLYLVRELLIRGGAAELLNH